MKNTKLFVGFFCFALAYLVSCKSKEIKSGNVEESAPTTTTSSGGGNWSSFQGKMNWDDADVKCKGLGMRLPTLDDLKSAYASGATKPWQSDGGYYWSSLPNGADSIYGLDVNDGNVSHSHSRNYGQGNVRCRR